MSNVIVHDFNGVSVAIRKSDGYVNATALQKAHKRDTGKRKDLNQWLRTQRAQETVKFISSVARINATELIQVFQGIHHEKQGTWVHPKIAVPFAIWLSVELEFFVTQIVQDWCANNKFESDEPEDSFLNVAHTAFGGGRNVKAPEKLPEDQRFSLDKYKNLAAGLTEMCQSVRSSAADKSEANLINQIVLDQLKNDLQNPDQKTKTDLVTPSQPKAKPHSPTPKTDTHPKVKRNRSKILTTTRSLHSAAEIAEIMGYTLQGYDSQVLGKHIATLGLPSKMVNKKRPGSKGTHPIKCYRNTQRIRAEIKKFFLNR